MVHSSASTEASNSRPIRDSAVVTTMASSATMRLAADASSRTQVVLVVPTGSAIEVTSCAGYGTKGGCAERIPFASMTTQLGRTDRSTQNKLAREVRGDSRGGAKGGAYSRNVRGRHGKLSRQVRP